MLGCLMEETLHYIYFPHKNPNEKTWTRDSAAWMIMSKEIRLGEYSFSNWNIETLTCKIMDLVYKFERMITNTNVSSKD